MTAVDFDSLWSLMTKHTFRLDPASIYDGGLTCLICHNLMIDACHSECGCQYCHKCVSEYLSEYDRCCPGAKDECKEEYLVLERDVQRNRRINIKVSKLRVQCPNECCDIIDELIKMEDHLRVCIYNKSECPYVIIGCYNEGGSKDTMCAHLSEYISEHGHMLKEYIKNMNNEFEGLKEDSKRSKLEIACLKEESRIKETQIENLSKDVELVKRSVEYYERIFEDQRRDIETLKMEGKMAQTNVCIVVDSLKTDMCEIKIRGNERKTEVEYIRNKMKTNEVTMKNIFEQMRTTNEDLGDREEQYRRIKNEMEFLKVESTKYKEETQSKFNNLKEENNQREIEVKMKEVFEEITKIKKEFEDEKKELRTIKDEMKILKIESTLYNQETRSKFNALKSNSDKCEDSIVERTENTEDRLVSLKETIERMDVWTREKSAVGETLFSVDSFSVRKTSGGVILSPYFYSHTNGYKLRLRVCPGGDFDGKGTHLSVYSVICKGEYDDELSWPCKQSIKISIINQSKGGEHTSETWSHSSVEDKYKHYFDKPIDKDNISLGCPSFIVHSVLFTSGICVNDIVVIKCTVGAPP